MLPEQPQEQVAMPPTSKAALSSMIAGLLGCLPFVASIAALVLGVVGWKKTAGDRMSGRGFAIVGLVLGGLGLVGWTAAGVSGYMLLKAGDPVRAFVREYVENLTNGDLAFTQANGTARFDYATMVRFRGYLQEHGGEYRGMSFHGFEVDNSKGLVIWTLNGTADFETGPADVSAQVRSADGFYTMMTLRIENHQWPEFNPSGAIPSDMPPTERVPTD